MQQQYEEEKEKIPYLSLNQVITWRGKISALLSPQLNKTLQSPTLERLALAITRKLSKKVKLDRELDLDTNDPVYSAVHRTLTAHAIGQPLDKPTIDKLSGVIAGNLVPLKAGMPVGVHCYQLHPEWVLTIIRDAYPYTTPHKQIFGHQLVFEVLTGSATGKTFQMFFTERSLAYLAVRIGAKKKDEHYVLSHKDFVRLYLLVKLRSGETLESEKYEERASLSKRNAVRAEKRRNYRTTCSRQKKWPCCVCSIGYDSCPQATHAESYKLLECRNGHLGWIDPKHPRSQCTRCSYAALIKRYGGKYEEESKEGSSSTTERPVDIPT